MSIELLCVPNDAAREFNILQVVENEPRKIICDRHIMFWVFGFSLPSVLFFLCFLLLFTSVPDNSGPCSQKVPSGRCQALGRCWYQYFDDVTMSVGRTSLLLSQHLFFERGLNPQCFGVEFDCNVSLPVNFNKDAICFEDQSDIRGKLFIYFSGQLEENKTTQPVFSVFLLFAYIVWIILAWFFAQSKRPSEVVRMNSNNE